MQSTVTTTYALSSSPVRAEGFAQCQSVSDGATFSRGGSDEQTDVVVPRDGGGLVSLRMFRCLKPVIAAINGPAVGLVTMTLPMDLCLASSAAKFGFGFGPPRSKVWLASWTSAPSFPERVSDSMPDIFPGWQEPELA
jgi:hypothetical protein